MVSSILAHATLIASALSITMAASSASAQSLTGNVGSANISQGERAIESRIGVDGNGNAAWRVHFEYAFSEWYQLRVIGVFAQPEDRDWDYAGTTLENWFQWREEAEDGGGFNGGVRLAYTFNNGEGPDAAAVRFTFTDKFADGWEWRANLIGEVETGSGRANGVFLETRAQLTRALNLSALGSDDWRLGAELFSELGNSRDIPDLDDQAHQLGPVLKVEWDNGVYLQTAARFGLTDASDDTLFKLFVGREF